MKKGLKALIIVVIILGVIVLAGVIAFNWIQKTMDEKLAAISIEDVDLSAIADGEYVGVSDAVIVRVRVNVVVADHAITRIDILEHMNGQGGPAEVIVDDVIEQQKLTVDTISGATASSKVILDAIENALQ